MLVDWFRRRAKIVIWFVVIVFVGSVFLLGAGTLFFGHRLDQQQAKQQEALRQAQAKREKGELDTSDTTELARVKLSGKERIVTAGEVNDMINAAMRRERARLPAGMDAQAVKALMGGQMLEQLIQLKLLDLAAEAAGIDVSAEREQIQSEVQSHQGEEGYPSDKAAINARIDQMLQQIRLQKLFARITDGAYKPEGMIQEYYNLNRGNAMFKDPKSNVPKSLDQVRGQILSILRASITATDIQSYYDAHKDRWRLPDRLKVEHLMIDPSSARYANQIKPTDAEIAQYYADHAKDKELQTDARVHLAHIFFDPTGSKYRQQVPVASDAIKAYYDAHKSDFVQPERAGVRRILLKVAYDAKPDEIARLDDKAQRLLKTIKGGKKFEDVAGESSEDLVTNKKGGDLGMVDKGTLSAELEHVVFSLKPGDISDVVKDDEGFQIVKVYAHEPERTKTLAEVSGEITKKLGEQQALELAQKDAAAIAAKAASPGVDFAQLAREVSQAPSKDKGGDIGILYLGENKKNPAVDEVGSYGYPDSAIQEAVKKLKEGEVSGVVTTAKGLHVLKVLQNLPSEVRPLADAREDISVKVTEEKRDRIGKDVVRTIRRRLADGEPFGKLVAELSDGADKAQKGLWDGIIVSTDDKQTVPKDLIKDVAMGDLLPDAVVSTLKGLTPGEISSPVTLGHNLHLFHEIERLPSTYKPLDDALKKKIQFALNPVVTAQEAEAYFDEHKSDFDKKTDARYQYLVVPDADAADDLAKQFAKDPKKFDAQDGKEDHEGYIKNSELRDAFEGLKPGEIHKTPFKTSFGYVIGRIVTPPSQGPVTYKQVEDAVKEKLLKQRKEDLFEEWLGEIKNQAIITRRTPPTATT